ncbi:transcriptional regulator [Leptospira perolatii]|uniref:Transcriptional regulator n=1 Tax=Leptospira perolatii TaxID=2023191 RepID=A0A2M9ZQD0_9LEPT|nr:metalloregulator ArsR/SmtB family transcription factor [Leptospira perolatii]PJZ68254.1 transcriptional regulator [Leptospira perolatii]PJZ74179.1 transcriptional regulator [Leptospira perolatii]
MPNKQETLNAIFHTLADPTRRAVVERLCEGPAAVGELARSFDMALPSFMQHLSVLEESMLVRSFKSGRVRTYQLVPKRLKQAEEWMTKRRSIWEQRLDQLDQYLYRLKEKEKEK